MPRFFVDPSQISDGFVTVTGDDAFHISRSLRMAKGEHIDVSDMQGTDYKCVLEDFSDGKVTASIISESRCKAEPPFYAVVWQALPKGDKLDSIIQKSVECGASEIRLFESKHCVAKTDPKSEQKKSERRARIALEAAKQCGRGILPKVFSPVSFDNMLEDAAKADLPVFCYEGSGTEGLASFLKKRRNGISKSGPFTVSIVIGPEGGFSPDEAERAKAAGLNPIGLGKRILRTETASTFALSALVYEFELG